MFVDDVVELNLYLLDHPQVRGILNCGSGRAESFRRLAELSAAHYPGARIVEVPFPDDLRGRYQAFTQADLTRLRAAGYAREFTPLERGVAAYVSVLKESGGHYSRPARP